MGFCEECHWTFQNIRLHKKLAHELKEEEWCCTCGRLFADPTYLKKHKATESVKSKFQCYVCSTTDFTSVESFSAHLEMHMEVHVYLCEICQKTFMKRQTYEEHKLKMHYQTPLFFWKKESETKRSVGRNLNPACAYSGKNNKATPSSSKESENNAMRVMSPEPSVSFNDGLTEKYIHCEDCRHDFVPIEIHRALFHHGKTQLLCKLCGQQFLKYKIFRSHFEGHQENTIKCYACHVRMQSSKELYKHLEEHKSLHIILCPSCPKTFAVVNRFNKHYKKKHSDVDEADVPGLLISTVNSENKNTSFKIKATNISITITDSDSFCDTNENENSPPLLKENDMLSSKKKRNHLNSLEDYVQTPAANNRNRSERDFSVPFSGPKDVSNALSSLKEKRNGKDTSFDITMEKQSGSGNSLHIVKQTPNKSICLDKSPSLAEEHNLKKCTPNKLSKRGCAVRLDNVFDNTLESDNSNREELSSIFHNNTSPNESELNNSKNSIKEKRNVLQLPNKTMFHSTPNGAKTLSKENNTDQKAQRKRKSYVNEKSASETVALNELSSDVDRVCFNCGIKFKRLNFLYRHYLLEHNNGTLDCKICGKVFHKDFSLYFDSMRHANLYPWECSLCKTSFKNKVYYRRHLQKVHGKLKKYKCELCEESFIYNLAYSAHVAEHTENKRFTCEHCSKQYRYKKFVEYHIENIKCKQCHITLPCKTLFKNHLDTVHPLDFLFQCPHCNVEFKTRDILRRHLTNKHFDKVVKNPVFCKFCEYVTHCKSNLSRHIKKHTN